METLSVRGFLVCTISLTSWGFVRYSDPQVTLTSYVITTLALATLPAVSGTAPASRAEAGGFVISELGNRRTAMAAVVGQPDEPAAAMHNPAGLVLVPGRRAYLSLGVAVIRTRFQLRPWTDSDDLLGAEAGADGYYAPVRPNRALAALPMLAFSAELWRRRLFGAAALYVSNATGSSFAPDAVTRYHMIEGYLVAPVGSFALAYRLTDRISIGAALGRAHVRLHARRLIYPVIDGNDVSSVIGRAPELVVDGSDWVTTYGFGLFVEPSARVSLGASLTARSKATLEGPLTLRYSDDVDQPQTLEGYHRTAYTIPWSAALGAHVDVSRRLELGVEARYWRYRDYREQRSEVDGIFLLRELVVAKDFRDSYQLSGGARLHDHPSLGGVELMSGLHYDTTPAPGRTITLDQPAFANIGLHAGARRAWGRFRLGASYVHLHYRVPTVADSITSPPSNFKGSGGAHILTTSLEVELP